MTEYEHLVKALRYCSTTKGMVYCNVNCKYGWEERSKGCKDILMTDAAAAIEALQAEVDKAKMYKRIEELEAEEKSRIVRCCDCKWYGIYYTKKDGTPDKRYRPSVCLRGKYAKRRDPDWFCADGEREVQE